MSDCFVFCLPSRMPAFDKKKGLVIEFEDFVFRKVKLKTTLDGVFMSILYFDWLVLHKSWQEKFVMSKKNKTKKETVLSCKQNNNKNSTTVLGPLCMDSLFLSSSSKQSNTGCNLSKWERKWFSQQLWPRKQQCYKHYKVMITENNFKRLIDSKVILLSGVRISSITRYQINHLNLSSAMRNPNWNFYLVDFLGKLLKSKFFILKAYKFVLFF